jgi:hypothetical protein
MTAMFERWKNVMIKGVEAMAANSPIDLDAELTALKSDLEALPLELEAWNEDDRQFQDYFQLNVGWPVDLLGKIPGIDGKFAKGAWNIYRYSISLIREIKADEQLLEIGKKLEAIAHKSIQSLAVQNVDDFYYRYYVQVMANKSTSEA